MLRLNHYSYFNSYCYCYYHYHHYHYYYPLVMTNIAMV